MSSTWFYFWILLSASWKYSGIAALRAILFGVHYIPTDAERGRNSCEARLMVDTVSGQCLKRNTNVS
ncbi:hypothetical protein BDV25DRAFT_166503 [Aspergillus avenaceus]|uniref:Uncharacterized protein n=1 Tax=Aspergillus avenaceus TaxID=36643 RepID=A0A5N6TE20_ASPAV|nr:hypothetical protein BDV25DRAFT_166503 [Aspergillus avenaceus]